MKKELFRIIEVIRQAKEENYLYACNQLLIFAENCNIITFNDSEVISIMLSQDAEITEENFKCFKF